MMGTFKLDRNGINKIRQHLHRQVLTVQKALACEAYDYFLNFEYHIDGGGVAPGGGGWSLYYLANWKCAVNGIDATVIQPERSIRRASAGAYDYAIDQLKATRICSDAQYGDSISITNSVYYGDWLNRGGLLPQTHQKTSKPNRFIELCVAHIHDSAKDIVKNIAQKEPEL